MRYLMLSILISSMLILSNGIVVSSAFAAGRHLSPTVESLTVEVSENTEESLKAKKESNKPGTGKTVAYAGGAAAIGGAIALLPGAIIGGIIGWLGCTFFCK